MNKEILIRLRIKKKYIVWFRLTMIAFALLSLLPIWNAFADGYFTTRISRYEIGHMATIPFAIKYILISALFVWLATGGVKEKEE